MPNIAVCGSPGMGKTTDIYNHFKTFKGWKAYFTYPVKEKDIALFKNIDTHVYTEFGEFLYNVLKHKGCTAAVDEADGLFHEKEPEAKQKWLIKTGRVQFINHPNIELLSSARAMDIFLYVILHDIRGFRPWMLKYFNGLRRYSTNDQIDVQIRRFSESWPGLTKNLKKHKKIQKFKSYYIPTPSYT